MICPVTVISARPQKAEIRILASDLEVCVCVRERESESAGRPRSRSRSRVKGSSSHII